MYFWMYHTVTGQVYHVPARTVEQVATLANTLTRRIYFMAELVPVGEDKVALAMIDGLPE